MPDGGSRARCRPRRSAYPGRAASARRCRARSATTPCPWTASMRPRHRRLREGRRRVRPSHALRRSLRRRRGIGLDAVERVEVALEGLLTAAAYDDLLLEPRDLLLEPGSVLFLR